MLTKNKRCGISFQTRAAITVFCIAALTLTAPAGDFIYDEGELRDGGYAGRVELGELFDCESGPGLPDYPGNIYRVAMNPNPSVSAYPIPGHGVCELYQLGWTADTPGANIPEFGLFQQGKVEFEMGAEVFAWASLHQEEPQDFSVGGTFVGPAYVESVTSVSGLSYELQFDPAFNEWPDDYIRVNLYMNLTREVWYNNDQYDQPYLDYQVDLDSNVIGTCGDNFQVLRNGEVVWEEGIDGWFIPSVSISIDARYGDIISLNGGVVSEVSVDSLAVYDMWSGSSKITLEGQMGLSPIQGSKSSIPLMPENVFSDSPWYFEPIDLLEKDSELGIDDPLWLAAPNAEGFLIEVEGSTFDGVQFEEIGNCLFDVYLIDEDTSELVLLEEDVPAGDTFYLPPGTEAFVVLGIEEDMMYPFGTPVGLLFESFSYPNVAFTPIPEPATLLLLAAGGGLILLRRRRG